MHRIPKYAAWASNEMYKLKCKTVSTRPIMWIYEIFSLHKISLVYSVNRTCWVVQCGIKRTSEYAAWGSEEMHTLECMALSYEVGMFTYLLH